MVNTQILILKTKDKTVTEERKYGAQLNITDDIERALHLVLQQHFDILIMDCELSQIDKTRVRLLAGFHIPDLITIENQDDDKDFSKAVAQGIRLKTLKNFEQVELHEKN